MSIYRAARAKKKAMMTKKKTISEYMRTMHEIYKGSQLETMYSKAADRIEHLEAENKRLVEAIREHKSEVDYVYAGRPHESYDEKLHAAIEGLEQ